MCEKNYFGRKILYVKIQAIDLHLFLKYHFPTVAFGTFCNCKSVWSWLPFCADGLLKIYNHHQIPLKKYVWFHYQPKRVTNIFQTENSKHTYIIREKKKKEHQNGKMVTQRQMNSLKRRFNASIKEVSDLLNENKQIKEGNVAVFIVCKENIEGQLQKYCK